MIIVITYCHHDISPYCHFYIISRWQARLLQVSSVVILIFITFPIVIPIIFILGRSLLPMSSTFYKKPILRTIDLCQYVGDTFCPSGTSSKNLYLLYIANSIIITITIPKQHYHHHHRQHHHHHHRQHHIAIAILIYKDKNPHDSKLITTCVLHFSMITVRVTMKKKYLKDTIFT